MDVGVVEVWPVEKGVAVVLAAHVVVAVAYRVVGSGGCGRRRRRHRRSELLLQLGLPRAALVLHSCSETVNICALLIHLHPSCQSQCFVTRTTHARSQQF